MKQFQNIFFLLAIAMSSACLAMDPPAGSSRRMQPPPRLNTSDEIKPLEFFYEDFRAFAELKPTIRVHKSTSGHFIPTGGKNHGLPGAQAVADFCKGHSDEQLISDIRQLRRGIQDALSLLYEEIKPVENALVQKGSPWRLLMAKRMLEHALRGLGESHGMYELLVTYADRNPVRHEWHIAIGEMSQHLDEIEGVLSNLDLAFLEQRKESAVDFFARQEVLYNLITIPAWHKIQCIAESGFKPLAYSANTKDEHIIPAIRNLREDILNSLGRIYRTFNAAKDDQVRKEVFAEFMTVNQALSALNKEGGILDTYRQSEDKTLYYEWRYVFDSMFFTLNSMKYFFALKEKINSDTNEGLPYCAEEKYSDEMWEREISAHAGLPREPFSFMDDIILYHMGLYYTRIGEAVGAFNWFDRIFTDASSNASLILGAVPEKPHLDQIKDQLKIGAVLSVVKYFENEGSGISENAISAEIWRKHNIKQLQLPTPDFEAISIANLQRGVAFIDWNIRNGRNIYVHCKAGRSRSALTTICYLIRHQKMTAEEAYSLVQKQRSQAGFQGEKMRSLKDFEKRVSVDRDPK